MNGFLSAIYLQQTYTYLSVRSGDKISRIDNKDNRIPLLH